jgi:hypothetical protein
MGVLCYEQMFDLATPDVADVANVADMAVERPQPTVWDVVRGERSGVALADAVAQVQAAISRLVRADVGSATDADLRAALAALTAIGSQVAGATARATSEFDARRIWAADGARSPQAWLRHECQIAGDDAARQVRHARHLRRLRVTLAALCEGMVTPAHVQRIVAADNPRTRFRLTCDEAAVVGWAREERFDHFCARLAEWRLEHDPDGAFSDRPERRRVYLTQVLQDGFLLDGWFEPVGGAIVANELDRREREQFEADWAEARARLGRAPQSHELLRTPAQRRADAMVEMARRSAAMSPGAKRGRVLVTVVAGAERFRRMCELLDGTLLTEAEVVRLLDRESTVECILFDDDFEPIAASRQRTFTGLLRRAIRVRDRECTGPLCDERAERCEVDHVVPWSRGGPTEVRNGRLRCDPHNPGIPPPRPPPG